jgi:multidrug efflux system membrane fusion protein
VFALGLFAATAVGCAKQPPPTAKAAAPDVFVELPVVRGVTDFEDFTGRTEAFKVVEVRPRVTGAVDAIHFKDGAFVKAGDPLIDIDDELFRAQKEGAEAALAKAQADVTNWKAQIEVATAEVNRFNQAKAAASPTEFDKAKATLDVAVAQQKAAEAAVKVAAAELKRADTTLAYTKITARYTGRMGRRMVDPGNIVKENDTVLTRLLVLDPIYVAFDIDERTLLRIRRLVSDGRVPSSRESPITVRVGLADEEGYSFSAPLTFVDNQLDVGTGTLRLRGEMRNPSIQHAGLPAAVGGAAATGADANAPRLLSPGMFVRIRFPVGREHPAVLIPEEAVGADQGQRYVFVLNDKDEAQYRRVTLGAQEGRLRVVEDGVKADDRVVVSGLQRVRAGMKVNPKRASPGGPPAGGRKQ